MGINTVDSFDIHTGIVDLRRTLDATAKEHKAVSIISAGWDPGSDSIVRTMLEAIAPKGITYTNFGPGMSMGHTVAVKAIDGVKAALSMTIPTGTGIHRRMVYIELKDGYKFEEVAAAIKADPYFVNDETHVKLVLSVDALLDMGHGVNLTRKGVSGKTQNQLFEFNMRINNPALTAQVLVCVARASMKQQRGGTTLETPPYSLPPGEGERGDWRCDIFSSQKKKKGGLCQNAGTTFFMHKAQTFTSPGFVITQSFCIFRHKVFRYGKVTFSSLHSQPNSSFSRKN